MKKMQLNAEQKSSGKKAGFDKKPAKPRNKIKTTHKNAPAEKKSAIHNDILSTLIAQAHEMVMITGLDGTIEYVNPYFEKITGYDKSEVLGKNPRILKSGPHDPYLYKELWTTITKGKNWRGILINKKKDGSLYSEEADIFPIKDTNGKIIKYASISHDISERKKAEEYILQQNKFFNNMIEAFTYPVYVIDVHTGGILVANTAAKSQNITNGMPHEKIHYGLKLLSGKSAKESLLEKIKKTKEPVFMEYTINDNKGNPIFRELYGYPIFDAQGNVIQIIEYIMDITDRKKSQEELVKLSQAVEQSLNIVMITDKYGVIEYVNPKFTETTGYSFQEVIGEKASSFGKISPEEKGNFWDILKKDGEWRGEFHNKKKNGEYYWEFASIYSIKNYQNVVTHYIKDAVNISKRKLAEDELKAAKEKAELANRFKSEFLANMSHEIRTPLNSILGFIELLLTTELDRQQKDYFETIKDSSRVLLGIIEDILDFSKIESGKLEIDNIKFYLKHELEPVVEMFVARADEKNIELLYFIDPSLPEYIFGDPLRIKQVLNNLISNAIKFTPEKGKIFVEIKLLELRDNLCRITFSVSDNGIGIPESKQKKIFEAFFQADSSVSRNYGGTGLGLAISRHLVHLMGGELQLESRVAEGSRFYFDLAFTEFSGLDIFKRDYDFRDVKCFLFKKKYNDKMQLYNIERYLKAFNIEVGTFSSLEEFSRPDHNLKTIIFTEYSIHTRDEISGIQHALPDIPIIMVANRLEKEFANLIVNKITKIIYKPVYASKIIGAIIEILFNEKQKPYADAIDEKAGRPFFSADALVAEDNAINQKLITLMLKEIGIKADIAKNGTEAVEKFIKGKYDIILMDVNMPVMDGIQATAEILKIEKSNEKQHTPIVALTAKSIKGDREIIINAGMDDYLSKPISINKLCGTIYPFLKHKQTNLSPDSSATQNQENQTQQAISQKTEQPAFLQTNNVAYDLAEIADELGVSIEFLNNLVRQFIGNFENYFSLISESVKTYNFDVIYAEAHKMKGTASNLRLNKLADYFSKMEANARNKDHGDYGALLNLIKEEIKILRTDFINHSEL
ncbi:MAG: PAS domain S-box protein [Spirochaetota bacterium]